jgi:hypothetical protein
MKKQYMLTIVLGIGMMAARAQSSYTTIQYNKTAQSALVLELPNTTQDVQGTILEKLKQTGHNPETQGHLFWKKNTVDGFYVFHNVVLPAIGARNLDVYFKVLQKNDAEKAHTTLYMLISKGNGNFSSPDVDTALWVGAETFLNGFIEKTTAYNLEQNIAAQQNAVKESREKLASLQKDEGDLAEKIRKYQADLLHNQENQRDQRQDIENQQRQLESLIAMRKS